MADKVEKNLLFTAIYIPNYKQQLDFKGYVKSISSINNEGAFDILPMHENFVTVLSGNLVIVDESGKKREIQVERALLEASNNLVKVFVEF